MLLNKNNRKEIVGRFRVFCGHSTLHGAYYFSTSRKWWVYLVWASIIIFNVSLCGFLGKMIWMKYAIDPTVTVVESTHHSTTDIPFPAVALCDSETIYGPNTENITNILHLRGYSVDQINEFYESFTAIRFKGLNPSAHVKKMNDIIEEIGYSTPVLLKLFKKPCETLLVNCFWRSEPHNCSTMFREVLTTFGYCCQFDISHFKISAKTGTNFVGGVEGVFALQVEINPLRVFANGTTSDGYVYLYVFDEDSSLTMLDTYEYLTPRMFFEIDIHVWAIDASDEVKSLPVRTRKCIIPSDRFGSANFYKGCIINTILQRVAHYCHCLPFMMAAQDLHGFDYAQCSWDKYMCVYPTMEKVISEVRDIVSLEECFQRCDLVEYEAMVQFMSLKRNGASNKSHSEFAVHFAENTCMKYRRDILYTWDQMLANLGGVFGLCLGGSIISIIELVWFLIEISYTVVTDMIKNMRKKKEVDKPFVIYKTDMGRKMSNKKKVGPYNFVH